MWKKVKREEEAKYKVQVRGGLAHNRKKTCENMTSNLESETERLRSPAYKKNKYGLGAKSGKHLNHTEI